MFLSRVLLVALVWLVSCTPNPKGSLKVDVTGLPGGSNANISVTGPANYNRKLTGSTTLSNLAVGTYTLSVAEVTSGNMAYLGSSNSPTVQVSANATATVEVGYFPKVVDESSDNNDKSTAQLLTYGMTANATIEVPGDQDWYRFIAQAGDFVKIDMDARSLSGAWGSGDGANGVVVELYSSNAPLAKSDSSSTIATLNAQYDPPGDSIITHLFSQAGTYFVRAVGNYGNEGNPDLKYALKLNKATPAWSSDTFRVAGGHLRDYERGPDGLLGVSVLGNAVVDIFEPGGDFNPTGKFNYSVKGPAGWNGGNPYSGSAEFFGHQVAILFTKDGDVPATLSRGDHKGQSLSIARVEPLQVGSYTLTLEVHGKTLSKTFSINSADALTIPQNIKVVPVSPSTLRVSWNPVNGAKKYVVFVNRPDGSIVRNTEGPTSTSTDVNLFSLQTGAKYLIEVFAHDFNYLSDTLEGRYNKSGHRATEFTYVAP